jgi:acyl carrier protein
MTDLQATRDAIREAMAEIVGRKVKDDEAVISSGFIDSLAVLKLISKIEKKLGIRIPPDNLQPDDFDSVEVTLETLGRVAEQA